MSPLAFLALCASVIFTACVLVSTDADEIVRFGFAAIVSAILANIERRANR